MKKLLSALLCLALILSCVMVFAACDDSGDPKETEGQTTPQTDAPTEAPTEEPTEEPTEAPTEAPTDEPAETTEQGEDGTTDVGENPDYDPEYYVVINSAEDLMNFNQKVNEVDEDGLLVNDYYDMTIVLTADIDLTGYTWTPLNGQGMDYTTFDGNGHTISNMEIIHDPEQGTPAEQIGAGFIGVASGDIIFKDITFDNCRITAYERAAACLIGCVTGGFMTFENVNVNNFTVDGWLDYGNQDRENGGHPICFRAAGFIGHIMAAGSTADFYNCHVDTIKLSGFHNLAGFIGYASQAVDEYCFEECSVSNAEFTFSYCLSASYTVDMPRKFVSVFYNASNWADNLDYCLEQGNTFSSVSYFDWTDDNAEYTAGEFRSWTREEANAG